MLIHSSMVQLNLTHNRDMLKPNIKTSDWPQNIKVNLWGTAICISCDEMHSQATNLNHHNYLPNSISKPSRNPDPITRVLEVWGTFVLKCNRTTGPSVVSLNIISMMGKFKFFNLETVLILTHFCVALAVVEGSCSLWSW